MELANDETPLEQGHVPEKVANRDTETQQLTQAAKQLHNIHLHGPRGTGKTHLTKKTLEKAEAKICYLSCIEYDTQYKALRKIYSELTGESIGTGHHTSELQRKIKERTGAVETIIVLDELDFLLLNDGDDLLYFLSRLETNGNLGLVLITANHQDLEEQVEPRTYSTLQPQRIGFEPYTGEQTYEILADRASKSLKPRTVHRAALTYIASSTQNTGYALTWFRTAVNNADDVVTEELVKRLQEKAYSLYVENQLSPLSQHHKILYQAITELSQESGPVINTGSIYNRYEIIAEERGSKPLSGRRISDYLKQLEQLNLISADYHYGGEKGKTREIRLASLQ
ncbi:AAA family ATPase [Halobacterium sp. NMX12-1]|uniref:AAA family ATPase n=1 Tax=Halobacterium sp. NMX12-1 TaxID=3166650 RepID=A0AAU8CD05_9EURY